MEPQPLTEEIKARVPESFKTGLAAVAANRHLKPADIIREAVREYLARRKRDVKRKP